MRTEFIKEKNKVLVLILRNGNFREGLNFYTKDKDFIQVATWNYNKGKKTIPHSHKVVKRTAKRTQEVIYVKSGKIKTGIYNNKGNLIKKLTLKTGDIAIIFAGGHAYEVLENHTQVLEIKNGPYLGLEKDKKLVKPKNGKI